MVYIYINKLCSETGRSKSEADIISAYVNLAHDTGIQVR